MVGTSVAWKEIVDRFWQCALYGALRTTRQVQVDRDDDCFCNVKLRSMAENVNRRLAFALTMGRAASVWGATQSFLEAEGCSRSLINLLLDTIKKKMHTRHRQSIKAVEVLDGLRSLKRPQLVINTFLHLSRLEHTGADAREWILFTSALLAFFGGNQTTQRQWSPSGGDLAAWVIRQTRGGAARQYPVIYSMCVELCIQQDCPRRVQLMLRCMVRDNAITEHVLCRVLEWGLGIEHYECCVDVLHMLHRVRRHNNTPTAHSSKRFRRSDVWVGGMQNAPKIVRTVVALMGDLGLLLSHLSPQIAAATHGADQSTTTDSGACADQATAVGTAPIGSGDTRNG